MTTTEEQKILDIKVKYEDAIYGVIRYKEKIDELNQAQEELNQAYKDGKITQNEYKVQSTATAAVITQYKDNVRVLRKELQNNVRVEQEQEGSLKQLRAELSNVTKAYDELSREEREGAKGKELQQHINNITSELKEAEQATQRFYRNVGNYEGAINNALFGNSKFGKSLQSIMDIAGETKGLSGVIDELKTKVSSFGTTLIGMFSNPLFATLAGIAGASAAFKWWWDYNEGLEKATRLTQQFTDLSGAQLINIRNEIQATSDTFDIEFNETLQSANTMAKGFGISIDEALKLIQDGLASGANANGEFLDTVKEYPRYFKEAGISAEGFVAIATNATKQGIFSDKGVDTIKEGNLRIREMTTATAAALDGIGISSKKVQEELTAGSKTTFDIMQEVAKKLQQLPASSAKVGTAIADIFGGPGEDAGLEYIKTLADIELNMDKVKDSTNGVAQAQEEQIKAQTELNNTVSALFDMTGGGFEKMKTQITTITQKALTELLKKVVSCINFFVDWYNKSMALRLAVQAIAVQVKVGWNTIKLVFNAIVDAIKYVARGFKGLGEVIEGALTLNPDKIKQGINDTLNNYVKTFKEFKTDFYKAGNDNGKALLDGMNNVLGKGQLKRIELNSGGQYQTNNSTSYNGSTNTNDNTSTSSTATPQKGQGKQKIVDQEKIDAAKRKAQEVQLQQDILKIQYQYNEKVMAAKKMYLADMYASDKDYQNELEALEKEELNDMLNTYVQAGAIGEEKAQEVSEKLLDIMIKAKENTAQQTKETVDALNKEFEETEKKRRDASIMLGGTGETTDEDNTAKLQRYQDFLNQKLTLYQDNAEVTKALQQELHDNEIDFQADANKKVSEKLQSQQQMIADVISSMGDDIADFFNQEDKSLHSFLKSMLTQLLSTIEKTIEMYYAEILAKQIALKSWSGVAQAAAMMALVKAAFAAAKAGVKSFAVGGLVTGDGTGTSDSIHARLSNGESVMTAKATSMFSPILSVFNQLGGGVPIVVNNGGSQMGEDMLAAAVAKGMAMAPQPVVSVEEIQRVTRRVEVLENLSKI